MTLSPVRHHDEHTMRLRPSALFNAATDAPAGGGASAAPAEPAGTLETAPAADAAAAPAPDAGAAPAAAPDAASTRPGVIAQATALLRGANGNAATIAALRTDLTSRDATIVALQADLAARDASITALTAELATFRTQAADLQSAVTALESQRVDVQTEVIHQLAAAGVTQEALPQGTTSTEGQQTPEELWSAAEATDDPKEKGRLAAKAMQASAKVRAAREKAALN